MQQRIKTRHMILGVMCLMYFIAYIDRVNISVAAPLIREEMGLTSSQLGLVFSAFAYPYAAMQILGGWMSDKFGPKKVLIVLSLIWGVATVLTGFAGSVMMLVVLRFVLGIGEGGAFPTATRAFTYWMPVAERGFAQGITHSFARLGGAITPPIVLAIVAAAGWREAFVVLGAVSLGWTVLYALTFKDTPDKHKRVTPEELQEIGYRRGDSQQAAKAPTPWRRLFRRMWLVTFVDFCYGWSLWVYLTWLPSYLKEARGFDLKQLALFTALPLMAGVVGDTLGGVLSDRIYRRTGNLRLSHLEDFSPHYAETLRRWREAFRERIADVRALGHSDEFIRLWTYYLCYCEAVFEEREVGVVQIHFDGPDCPSDPLGVGQRAVLDPARRHREREATCRS